MHVDVTIIGGGILGLAAAKQLAASGCTSVIIEREQSVAQHASGKNAGMFRQLYRNPQLTAWAKKSSELWPTNIAESCFRTTGSYVVGRKCPTHASELFSQRTLEAAKQSSVEAVYCKTDGLLDSPRFMSLLCQELSSKYSRIAFDTVAHNAQWSDGTWKVATGNSTIESPLLIIANGAWAAKLPILGLGSELHLPTKLLQPYARYLVVVEGFPKGFMPEPDCGFYWDEVGEWYLREWDENSRLLSICDQVAADPDDFPSFKLPVQRVRKVLDSAFPNFSQDLKIRESWHCFRTYTPDQLPIWGPDPRQDNLFWLVGFGGFGMSTGYAAASELSDLLLNGQTSVSTDVIIRRLLTTQ